jgi:hypothetical protein
MKSSLSFIAAASPHFPFAASAANGPLLSYFVGERRRAYRLVSSLSRAAGEKGPVDAHLRGDGK